MEKKLINGIEYNFPEDFTAYPVDITIDKNRRLYAANAKLPRNLVKTTPQQWAEYHAEVDAAYREAGLRIERYYAERFQLA